MFGSGLVLSVSGWFCEDWTAGGSNVLMFKFSLVRSAWQGFQKGAKGGPLLFAGIEASGDTVTYRYHLLLVPD